jgi:DUF1365 family protein
MYSVFMPRLDNDQLKLQLSKLRKTTRHDLDSELATSVRASDSSDSCQALLLQALDRIKKSSGLDSYDGDEDDDVENHDFDD